MNTQQYPLLIEGFYSNQNGSNPSVVATAGTAINWQNSITEGRGNVVMLDIVASGITTPSVANIGDVSLLVSSQTVIENSELANYTAAAYPRSYELTPLEQRPGQTLQLVLNPLSTIGAVVHAYYENQFATEQIIKARYSSVLRQKTKEYRETFIFGRDILRGDTITIPTALGNVVAIQFFTYDDTSVPGDAYQLTLLSCFVDGIRILNKAASPLFSPTSGRPGLVFPIFIKGGSTIQLEADTRYATVGQIVFGIRLYFDDTVSV